MQHLSSRIPLGWLLHPSGIEMCTRQNFAERLCKPTRTAQLGYAEHGSKSCCVEGTYTEATRRLRRAMPATLFAYPGEVQSKKNAAHGGVLKWYPKTMGFNTIVWPSLTWMIWGIPILGNPRVIILWDTQDQHTYIYIYIYI